MGNALISDTFHPDRLDYIYTLQPGGGERQQEHASIRFNDNDQLIGLSSDYQPGLSRNEQILGQQTEPMPNTAPLPQPPTASPEQAPAPGSLLEKIQGDVDNAETSAVPSPEPLESTPEQSE
jgi:outer membrane protein assembly factor BamE